MNKYEIVETLGQGGYGKANLVRRKTDKKLFVEKEVRLTALSPKDRDGAIQEAKLLASLRHPYIVEYEESFQENGYLYIVMGYADGGDLAKKIESRGNKLFTEEEILHDFIEIALAIKYIHDRKICHRDLKGQNIFLTKDGTIKLGDFGISKILETTFQACKTQIGTPFYLSPEICQGMEYNTKTDIWSLGCILYELCTLKHAFKAPNISVLMVNIIQARYSPIPSQYSQDLKSLVDKMLTKEPEKRPSINQILNIPYLKKRLPNFLDKELLDYEMGHTRLHNRKPFAAPTVIVSKDQPSQPPSKPQKVQNEPSIPAVASSPSINDDDYLEEFKEKQKLLKMKDAALRKKEAELAARERALQSSEDDFRSKQYYDQRRASFNDNKARMQQELSGNNMKNAIQNQFPIEKDDYKRAYNDRNNNSSYDQQVRDNYIEQLKMARANRERLKREEFQGLEMQRALTDSQFDDESVYQKNYKRKGGSEDYEALNAYMRQQRHEALENKKRLEEAQRGSAAKAALAQEPEERNRTIKRKFFNEKTGAIDYDYYSDYYSDYSDAPPPSSRSQLNQKQKQNQKDDFEARNEYMRQLRHEREANRLRAQEYENLAKEQEKKRQSGSSSTTSTTVNQNQNQQQTTQKEKKPEISQADRNAYMREERHKRRENKSKIEAMGQVNMDKLISEAESKQVNKIQSTQNSNKKSADSIELKPESKPLTKNKCESGFLEQTYSCSNPIKDVKFNIQKLDSNKYVKIESDGITSFEIIQKGMPNNPERLKFRTFISFPEKGQYKIELIINGRSEMIYNVDAVSKSSQNVPIDSTPFNIYKFIPISPKSILSTVTDGVAYFRFAASKILNCYFDLGKIEGKTFNYESRKKYGGFKISAIKLVIPFDDERWEYDCVANFPSDGRWVITISMDDDDESKSISEVTKFYYDVTGTSPKRNKVSPLEYMHKGRTLAPENKIKVTQAQIDELPDPPQSEKKVMDDLKNVLKQDNSKNNSQVNVNNGKTADKNYNNGPDVNEKNENRDNEQSKCCLLI